MRRIDDRKTCRFLRTKGMFVEAEPDPAVPSTDSGLCWCVHTQNQLGPDGRVAEPERCGPGRRCYEAK
ncbi:MAG TPA: hypothetical protein VF150_12890 [Thermoanaerobaculia bacterium]